MKKRSIVWTKINDDEFKDLVMSSKTYKEIFEFFGIENKGGNNNTIKKRIKELGLSVSHFDKPQKGFINYINSKKRDLSEILVENSDYKRAPLRRRIIKENLIEQVCGICGIRDEWNGLPLVLILDHINGVNNDNRLENLRFVCPNCNYQLPTHGGKNTKRRKDDKCSCGSYKNPSSDNCIACNGVANRKVERPSLEILLKEVEDNGYSATGRKYGVSGNAIKKWIN